jgi:hypothetical protein
MSDISKTTIAVLLAVTILVSVFGTLALLNTIDNAGSKIPAESYGNVRLSIGAPSAPQIATGHGQVALVISPRA